MLTKSSKSLSRKELLLEYSKLRELYEVQQLDLRAKVEQIHFLIENSAAREVSTPEDSTEDSSEENTNLPADALIAIEANLKQQFENERLEMIAKLQHLHSINVRLVERITLMQQAKQRTDFVKKESFVGAATDSTPSLNQSKQKDGIDPAMRISAA